MNPLVTIMIPTYLQANVIGRAIESALSQDYQNLEVVVADDNSPDNTEQKIALYLDDKRLRYFKNPTNLGRVKNYKNILEKHARGEWVVNLDGDDFYCDNSFVSQCIKLIVRHPEDEVVFVQGGKIKQKINKRELSMPSIKNEFQLLDGQEYFLNFPSTRNFSHMSTLYNRKAALELDFYRMNITSADLESFLRLALHGKVILVKKAFGVWVEHEDNASNRVDIDTQERNLAYITSVSAHAHKVGLDGPTLDSWREKMVLGYYHSLLLKVVANKNLVGAGSYFFSVFKNKPKIVSRLLTDLTFIKSIVLALLKIH